MKHIADTVKSFTIQFAESKIYSPAIMNNFIMDRDCLQPLFLYISPRDKSQRHDSMTGNASTSDVNFLVETVLTIVIKFF